MIICCLLNNAHHKLDISDIITKSKQIADSHFSNDANGNVYSKSKYWCVYNKYVDKNSLSGLLKDTKWEKSTDTLNTFIVNRQVKRIKIIYSNTIKANETFNFIVLQKPVYNASQGIYNSIIWIRDKSWTSGFFIFVYYRIINHKCWFIKGKPLVISDIQD